MNIQKALFAVLLLAGLSLPSFACAATLSFTPAYSTVNNGQTVTLNIIVSSTDQAMNATAGVISFPADKLQVVSISKANSIVSFWIQEPAFSNGAGTVNFEGVIPNPGYTGASGKILSVTFRAKSVGTAAVSFSSASVLANDGQGTELLKNTGGANITIQAYVPPAVVPTPTTSVATSTIPAGNETTVVAPVVPALNILGFPVSSSVISMLWLIINYLSVCLLVGLLVLALYFAGKYAWRLARRWWFVAVRREDRRYGAELLLIHKELHEEVGHLESAKERGELDEGKKRLLERLEKACKEIKEIAGRLGS